MAPLETAYATSVKTIRARVLQFAIRAFHASEFRDADRDAFVRTVVPLILAGQKQTSALTDAYLARYLADGGVPTRTFGPIADYPRGVPPAEVYARPYVTVWTALSRGHDLASAIAQGEKRLIDLTATDMQLAKTHTARRVMEAAPQVTGYQRTLTGTKSCALCWLASTQEYHKRDLLPIHPGCDCGVAPIIGGDFDRDAELEAVHEAVADRLGASDRGGRAPDYRNLIVHSHGELGPTLGVRGQHFTGPGDLTA